MTTSLTVALTVAAATTPEGVLRTDGVPVFRNYTYATYLREASGSYPFKPFSDAAVRKALASSVDWVAKGAVTPAKDQGQTGYCGTFGRVAAAEGQYALRSHHGLVSFSEEMLVDCIGWDRDQFSFFSQKGFMSSEAYPFTSGAGPSMDPPIPNHPCRYDTSKVLADTASGHFSGATGAAPSEDQLVAFVAKNGPVQTGINADVFALRERGCEEKGDCFITQAMCNDPSIKGKQIDHSIAIVGFGTDAKRGDYWLVKNSWSARFANKGFIKVARGISCGRIDCCGNVFTMGDPASYYE